jgi:4-amino-4-deoxy-L-arabinose transferase-like glycosyltransferase
VPGKRSRADARGATAAKRGARWRFWALSGAILALATALRLLGLDTQELWLDESWSFHTAGESWSWGERLRHNTPPLHSVLVRASLALGGVGETWVRFPSAVAGIVFVALVLAAGSRIVSIPVGLWAGALAAISPIHIYYSQEARAYSLVIALLMAVYLALWRALDRNRMGDWLLVAGLSVAALYSHYLALLGFLPAPLLVSAHPRAQNGSLPLRQIAGAALLVAVACGPWYVASFLVHSGEIAGTTWTFDAWELTPPALALPKTLEVFALGSEIELLPIDLKQMSRISIAPWLRGMGLAASCFLALVALLPFGDRRLEALRPGRLKLLLTAWLLGVPLVLFAISLVRPIYVAGRYELVAYPAFPLLLGMGLAKLQGLPRAGPAAAALGFVLLLVPIGSKLAAYYRAPPVADSRSLAAYLDREVEDGDLVIFTELRGLPALTYLRWRGFQVQGGRCSEPAGRRVFSCRMYPRYTEQTLGYDDKNSQDAAPDLADREADALLRRAGPEPDSIWIALGSYQTSQDAMVTMSPLDAELVWALEERGYGAPAASESGFELGVLRMQNGDSPQEADPGAADRTDKRVFEVR